LTDEMMAIDIDDVARKKNQSKRLLV